MFRTTIFHAVSSPRAVVLLAVAAGIACSDAPTAPAKVSPSLQIVSGESQTDTIDAQLTVPLMVMVRDDTGKPAIRTGVTFRVLPMPGAPAFPPEPPALVSPTSYVYTPGPQTAMAEATDSTGITGVTVRFGKLAGQVRIAIDGDGLPVHDTVTYTVLPGAAVKLDVQPSDTSVYLGSRYQLRVRSLDRAGNVRSDKATLTGGDSVVALDATQGATGIRFGRDFTLVATATHTALARVSVVPQGTLAVSIGGYATDPGVGVINLDGSGRRRLFPNDVIPSTASTPAWSPDGKWVAAVEGGRVYVVDASSGIGRMVTPDFGLGAQRDPRFSPDGRWIYFTASALDQFNQYTLWRVRVDSGSTAEQLPVPVQYTPYEADVSPDGARVLYVGGDAYLHELTLADSSSRTLTATYGNLRGPRYSPDGATIAYTVTATSDRDLDVAGVYTIPVQGSAARRVTAQLLPYSNTFPSNYMGGNAWTSDGQWIVTCATDRIYMVEVSTGLLLPLPWSEHDYTEPSWKP